MMFRGLSRAGGSTRPDPRKQNLDRSANLVYAAAVERSRLFQWNVFYSYLSCVRTACYWTDDHQVIFHNLSPHVMAGMIVLGSRGLGRLRRTFTSSVSDHVLHRAKCPVIICRAAASGDATISNGNNSNTDL